jgi:hypothetical protein
MITAHTISGSVYQIDKDQSRFRRVKESSYSKSLPLNTWIEYDYLVPDQLHPGGRVVIYHGKDGRSFLQSSQIKMLIES